MANRTKFTHRVRGTFLETLSQTANVREAAEAAGLSRRTAYDHWEADPAFAAARDEVIGDAVDRLEREAFRRAVEGWDEPVYYQGQQVGSVRKYSDRMLELLLKANRDKYKDHSRHAVGPDTALIIKDLTGGPNQLEQREERDITPDRKDEGGG